MQIKNLNIIFTFITYFVITLAAPVKESSLDLSNIDDVKASREVILGADDETVVNSESEDSDEYDVTDTEASGVAEEDSEAETEVATEGVEDDFQLPTEIKWTYTPEEVLGLTDKVIAHIKKVDQSIYAVADEDCSFDTVIAPYAKLENELELVRSNIDFFQSVSPIKELRDAADEFVKKIDEISIERSTDKKMYQKIAKVIENIESGKFKGPEHPEDKRFLEQVDKEFRNSGLALPDDKLAELKELQTKLGEVRNAFSRCVNEEEVGTVFTREELDGMTDEFIDSLKPATKNGKEGLYVSLDVPTYNDMMAHITSSDVRKIVMRVYHQRCKGNLDRMHEAIDLRLKIAKILGYETHADHVLTNQMAKKPETVNKFLASLREKLNPLGKKEMEVLLQLKKEEAEAKNKPFDGTFCEWDVSYFNGKLMEKEYNIKDDEIKQYFPMDKVTEEMLKLYSEVFGLKFEEVEKPVAWHPDVRQLEVYESDTNAYVGTIYLDLYPRDGKYNHFAAFGITSGFEKEDGSIVTPVGSLVTNFPKPTANKPSLLLHDDVVTYFHEFGHAIHQISSRHKYARFNGFYVESDFVEAPSQMNENFCWEAKVLERISHHYQDSSKSLPKDLIENLVKTRNVSGALANLRQIFFGLIDMELHYRTEVPADYDVNKAYNELHKVVVPYLTDDESWGLARFNHLMGGYDAGYYGYLYSQVFAADMYFTKFQPNGIINQEIGIDYRKNVLGKGATKDAMELLKDFLGREPNDDAFIKSLGI